MQSIIKALAVVAFFIPLPSYAQVEIYTSDQLGVGADVDMTIESDGYKFTLLDVTTGNEDIYFDNDILFSTYGDGEYVMTYSSDISGCSFFRFRTLSSLSRDASISTVSTTTATHTFSYIGALSADVTGFRFSAGSSCSIGSYATIHSLYIDDVAVFDFTPEPEPEPDTILTPPMLILSQLTTTTCSGTSTSSVCVYSYATSTATDTVAYILDQAHGDILLIGLILLWIAIFLFVFLLVRLLVNNRYGHY